MKRWLLAVALFCFANAYWAYAIDLECHVNGYLQCLDEHSGDPTGCSAPAVQVSVLEEVDCGEIPRLVVPGLAELPPQSTTERLDGKLDWRPPEPAFHEPCPPRGPPLTLS